MSTGFQSGIEFGSEALDSLLSLELVAQVGSMGFDPGGLLETLIPVGAILH